LAVTASSNMDMRDHHLGRIVTVNTSGDGSQTDVGTLIRRLLLFDKCTVESNLLREVPDLVCAFGEDGLRELVDSGALSFVVDAMTAGQVGQTSNLKSTEKR
jgi:hypothetical protein